MKRFCLIMSLILAAIAGPDSLARAQQAPPPCEDKIKIELPNRQLKNALTGEPEISGALIFRFSLEYVRCAASPLPKVVQANNFTLSVSSLNLIEPSNFKKLSVVDVASGEKYEARFELRQSTASGAIVVSQPIKLQDGQPRNFSLLVDFTKLKRGAQFDITFSTSTMMFFVVGDVSIRAEDYTGGSFKHYNGNRAPKLFWVDYTKMVPVAPREGFSGETFDFSVSYSDDDNDPPKVAQVWIDLNGDGKYEESEKFNMSPTGPVDDFQKPVIYSRSIRITLKRAARIKFRFYFTDGKDEAISGVSRGEGSIPTDEFSVAVQTPVAFGPVRFSSPQFVAGETLKVVVPVFYLYRDIAVDWSSVAKNLFAPFTLVHWEVGRHGIESPEYELPSERFDFQEIIIFLDTKGIKNSIAALPEMFVDYKVAGNSKKFRISSDRVKIPRVKLRVAREISQQLIRIGDRFEYRIRVTRTPDVELLDFKPQNIIFEPLEIENFSARTRSFYGYVVDDYVWTLTSFYMLQEPLKLPTLELNWHTDGSKKINTEKIEPVAIGLVPTLGNADELLSVWDAGSIRWPKQKTWLLIYLPAVLGSAVLASFIGYCVMRRIMVWLAVWQESRARLFRITRRQARRLIKALLNSESDQLAELLNHIKVLIGLNCGLAAETSQALTASEIESLLLKAGRASDLWRLKPEDYSDLPLRQIEKAAFEMDIASEHCELQIALLRVKKYLRKIRYAPRS